MGELRSEIARLVGTSLQPDDHHAAFEQKYGHFWYDTLFTFSKLARGEVWVARQAFQQRVRSPLIFLLRTEAGATEKWQTNDPSVDLERVVCSERLAQLDACMPDATPDWQGVREKYCRAWVTSANRSSSLAEIYCAAGSSNPARSAYRTSSERWLKPSLCMIRCRYVSTVFGDRKS